MTYPENMPILYRNAMDALPSDFARDVFLWAVERPNEDRMCYRAERLACEVDSLLRVMGYILDRREWVTFTKGGMLLDEDQRADLERFVITRWANWRFGRNTNLPEHLMVQA